MKKQRNDALDALSRGEPLDVDRMFNYRTSTCNDEHVCNECRAASKVAYAYDDRPRTPLAVCQSPDGCRCFVTTTNRPVGPIKPVPVTSGAHRKGRKRNFDPARDGCIKDQSPSPIERLLGTLRGRKRR